MIRTAALLLVILLSMTGCVRRDGRNSDCQWPGETGASALDPGQSRDRRHLSADAEFAEDLAIRYADTHHGLRTSHFESREAYAKARNRCLGTMFEEIGKAHGVTPKTVFESLGRNRAGVDLAMNLPFVLLYLLAAAVAARRIRRRYPPEEGWIPGLVMVAVCSMAFGVGGMLLGEQGSTLAETIRIGNGHLSYRLERVPWVRYQTELFASAVVVFWFVAAALYRTRYTPPT